MDQIQNSNFQDENNRQEINGGKRARGLTVVLVLFGIFVIVGISAVIGYKICENNNIDKTDKTNTISKDTTDLNIPKILRADKDVCGDISFKISLTSDYESALAKYTTLMTDEYTRWCPQQPCYNIRIDSEKVQEVEDLDGNVVDIDLYILSIVDTETETKLTSIHDAIDSYGNWYEIEWCED